LVSQLANYTLPQFVLEKVASRCGSHLARKGKIKTILDGMNESALELLYKIFIKCEDDEQGEFSDFRFGVFLSTRLHSKVAFDQAVTGKSGKIYKVKVAVFGDQGMIAVGQNKSTGGKVSIDELKEFNEMIMDVSRSIDGINLLYAFYCSSLGYDSDFKRAFVGNPKTRTPVNKYGYSIPKAITLLQFRDKNTNEVFSAPF
jgi:hypothetical protein